MNEFIRPCTLNDCETPDGEQAKNPLCSGIAEAIVNAGGASVFEATPCSIEALSIITYSETERSAELRKMLGIISIIDTEDGF